MYKIFLIVLFIPAFCLGQAHQNLWLKYVNLGDKQKMAKDYNGAIAYYTKSIQIHPDYKTYQKRAEMRFVEQDMAGAINDCSKAIELINLNHPNNTDAVYNAYALKGSVEYISQHYQNGLNDLSYAVKIQPNNSLAYMNLALAQLKFGKKPEACLSWQNAARLYKAAALDSLKKYCK